MYVIFETPRLLLRRFTIEDAALILQLNSDPEVLKYLHEPILTDEIKAREIISNIILPQYENNLGRWAMLLKEGQAFIGWCGLKYREDLKETDLGYRLMKKAWGMGYATEAAQHTLTYGFDKLKLGMVTARAHADNIPSQRVLEKIGMQYTGEGIADNCPVKTYTAKLPV